MISSLVNIKYLNNTGFIISDDFGIYLKQIDSESLFHKVLQRLFTPSVMSIRYFSS